MTTKTPLKANFTGSDVTSLGEFASTDSIAVADGGTGGVTAGEARTNLGVVIGTDVLAPTGDGSALTGIDALPTQTSQSGKILTTNGSAASWVTPTDTTYSIGDGGLTQVNFTTADNTKLDGIEASATADQTKSEIDALGIAATSVTGSQASAITANTAKVTNATHTGDVTGGTVLTISTDAVDIAMLSATGTAGSTTFLRGDNTWATAGSTSATDLTSGTLPDARFPSTLPAIDGSALTGLTAGGNVADFVASGTLPNGSPVILKADGTVEVVGGVPITESIPAGSEAVLNSGSTVQTSVDFDPNNSGKFVVTYVDSGNSSYGKAVVGTISGTSISFGSEAVFNSGSTVWTSLSFDPNNNGKFVVVYRDSGNLNYGTAIVGTISGTSISFGSEYVFNSGNIYYPSVDFDPNNSGKFVVTYKDYNNSLYGTAIIGSVGGNTISFGSKYVFNTADTRDISVAVDPNTAGKFVVAYEDRGNSQTGTAIVGTISGTSISFGSEVTFNSGNSSVFSVSFNPNTAGKFVVAYTDWLDSGYGKAVVGTISGTSISFGSEAVFNSGSTSYNSLSFDPNTADKFVVVYRDSGNSSYGIAVVGTISGTSASFGSEYVFNSGVSSHNSVDFDPNNSGKFVVAYQDGGNLNYGTAILGQIAATGTNLTDTNFLGTSTASYTNGQSASIALQGGITTNQSGLTAGSTYYVQGDATLTTTAGTPSVVAGKAISATTLLLKGI